MNAQVARWITLRLLGLSLLAAVLSFWAQFDGLVGEQGITPATDLLRRTADWALEKDVSAVWRMPTLGWLIGGSNAALHAICALGAGAALALILNLAPRLALFIGWLSYLSIFHLGGPFLSFQWDILLVEALLVAIPYAPSGWRPRLKDAPEPSVVAVWLMRLLVFKLILSSGVVKLTSGDPTWRDLTALDYHFWTQPLPHALAWWAHAAEWSHAPGVLLTFVVELGAPLLIVFDVRRWRLLPFLGLLTWAALRLTEGVFGGWQLLGLLALVAALDERVLARLWPRRFGTGRSDRSAACLLIVGLMLAISLTGNYGFFQLLTVALAVSLVDDHALRWVPGIRRPALRLLTPTRTRALAIGFAVIILPLSALQMTGLVGRRAQRAAERAVAADQAAWSDHLIDSLRRARSAALEHTRPFVSVNSYGLFATMTTQRVEIVVEGSADGRTDWQPYRFAYRPSDPARVGPSAGMHMPRLDWQMWFAALSPRCRRGWYVAFAKALLDGSPAVRGLLAADPFAGKPPPQAIRSRKRRYRFTDRATRAQSGAVWQVEDAGSYCPTITPKMFP